MDRNPRPSKDDYINILPDFLCPVVTYRSSNKELSLLARILFASCHMLKQYKKGGVGYFYLFFARFEPRTSE